MKAKARSDRGAPRSRRGRGPTTNDRLAAPHQRLRDPHVEASGRPSQAKHSPAPVRPRDFGARGPPTRGGKGPRPAPRSAPPSPSAATRHGWASPTRHTSLASSDHVVSREVGTRGRLSNPVTVPAGGHDGFHKPHLDRRQVRPRVVGKGKERRARMGGPGQTGGHLPCPPAPGPDLPSKIDPIPCLPEGVKGEKKGSN